MSHLLSLIKDRINFWVLLPILILIAIFTSTVVFDLSSILPQDTQNKIIALPQPKSTIFLSLLLLSMYLCYAWLFSTYIKKPRQNDYELINPPGFLKNKKTGRYYCQKCLVEKHLESELSVISKEEFKCRVCNEPYKTDLLLLLNDSYLSKVQDNDPLFKMHHTAVQEQIKQEPSLGEPKINILKLLFTHDKLTTEQIADEIGLQIQTAKYHLVELAKLGMVNSQRFNQQFLGAGPFDLPSLRRYSAWTIMQPGRKYLLDKKLES